MCTGLVVVVVVVVIVVVVVVVMFSITVLFIYFLLRMSSLSICAILLTVFDFSTYVVNKHLIINTKIQSICILSSGHLCVAYKINCK